jgi:hypothetical protein
MTDAHKTMTLARPLKAFEIDPSWYRSYWYDRPQSELRNPSFRSFRFLVWAAVFVAGTYFAF